MERYRLSNEKPPLRYRSPKQRLSDRLASLARHRRHVTEELRRLERFLAEHPEFRSMVAPENASPRLVVDNTPGRKRRRRSGTGTRPDGIRGFELTLPDG
jgi:hypothetical protein